MYMGELTSLAFIADGTGNLLLIQLKNNFALQIEVIGTVCIAHILNENVLGPHLCGLGNWNGNTHGADHRIDKLVVLVLGLIQGL